MPGGFASGSFLGYCLSYSAFIDLLDVFRLQLTAKDLAQARRFKGGPVDRTRLTRPRAPLLIISASWFPVALLQVLL
jgi:hypothetical protein